MKKLLTCCAVLLLRMLAAAQSPPGLPQISEASLKRDLYALADAHFRGRSAGTVDELKAAAWLAERYRAIGLNPAGDDSTYFQFFNLWRSELSDRSTITINNKSLQIGNDVLVAQMANTSFNGPIIYLGDAAKVDTSRTDLSGRVVAMLANGSGINLNISLPTWRYQRYVFIKYGAPLLRHGAAAVIFVADEEGERSWADEAANYQRGNYDLAPPTITELNNARPVLWLHATARPELETGVATIQANLIVSQYSYPSVNVIGKVAGTDSRQRNEYLAYSGHVDAHGIRNPINNDSTYYGADDNGSVDVAMLAIAAAFAKHPAKRSVLFIIHGAEERGLFGSRYFTQHPTVPIGNLVAVLNGDMIGRNATDSAALLGVNPPHRNSAELVSMAFDANREGPRFVVDTSWDSPRHPEVWYFRSDHLPYARAGVPALMFSSLLHPDYHTPADNAANINYPKLKKMTDWMYRTGWKVANAPRRPAVDPGFRLER